MKIKNVLFDLDGTLLDTSKGITDAVVFAIKEMGFIMPDTDVLPKFVGPPIQESFSRFCSCSKDDAQAGAETFRKYYMENTLYDANLYNGVYELMDALQHDGYTIAIATYKREDYALQLLRHFNFHKYCASMHGADNENRRKKQDIIKLCLRDLDCTASSAVYVGDTEHDELGAKVTGMPFIAITYGFGYRIKDMSDGKVECIGYANAPSDVYNILRLANGKNSG